MKYVIALLAVICGFLFRGPPVNVQAAPVQNKILSYQQLVNYPVDCKLKDEQLAELLTIQKIKNFNPNSDELSEDDYHYNSRLKATIWYYAYGCEK